MQQVSFNLGNGSSNINEVIRAVLNFFFFFFFFLRKDFPRTKIEKEQKAQKAQKTNKGHKVQKAQK